MIALKPPFQASDMNGLYKRVVRGIFPKLPKQYSSDLQMVVSALLKVDAKQRPDCAQIIKLPTFQRKSQELFPDDPLNDSEQSELLKTIRIPKNIMYLSNKLPQANYGLIRRRHNAYKQQLNRSMNPKASPKQYLAS